MSEPIINPSENLAISQICEPAISHLGSVCQ